MADPGRVLSKFPRPEAPRRECPGCHQTTCPERLAVCGKCFWELPSATRATLRLKDTRREERLDDLRRQLAQGTRLADIQIAV